MSIRNNVLALVEEEGPLSKAEIFRALAVNGNLEKEMKSLLKDMVKDGVLYRDEDKRYRASEKEGLMAGRLQGNEKGFGFFVPDDETLEDLYIHGTKMNTAMHNDRVLVEKIPPKDPEKGEEGRVVTVLERANHRIVGIFDDAGKFGFVKPDERKISMDIYIPGKRTAGAREGQKVVVDIEKFPTPNRKAEGKIVEILGYPDEKNVDILSIAYALGIDLEFPREVLEEAEAIPQTVPTSAIAGRRDLREIPTFTIDGADSKDFDDALSIEFLENGRYRVGVHIADVAEYVVAGSHLDKEAYKRGNSVYLLNKVIPMLPKELSNGICSLNEGVDRLCLTLLAEVDDAGKVYDFDICESVIRSDRRLVYTHVSDLLEDGKIHPSLEGLEAALIKLNEIARARKKMRNERGNIDFYFEEPYIELDDEGRPISITLYDHREANELIEEFMLLANETVSETYSKKKLPFIYRIHEEPSQEKLELLNSIIRPFGHHIDLTRDVTPKDIQKITQGVVGKDEESLVQTMVLRSMQKARYSDQRDIHFGLAAVYYSHFTSPIRRYADLTIHRVIKQDLNKTLDQRLVDRYKMSFPDIADHISETEKVAQEAERKVVDVKMAQYMSDFIGEEFPAKVSGITSFGIFAQLENTVEGLISYASLDEFYRFDEDNYMAVGERTHREIKMGDPIRVVVVGTDPIKGKIDFGMAGEENSKKDKPERTGQ
ncbi:ribonuclease R [Peptoniphilus ivorii]|uniref:ribonuclease R n=1 Tax=Aedoeadaptatus ivorii TaxID=54006 RepID=UPI00277F1565|nr:ribonuclease R [Peptoniphilus ivorii]MDQ0508815.1 ribonuclease R [Peptoniphilus ivorii]